MLPFAPHYQTFTTIFSIFDLTLALSFRRGGYRKMELYLLIFATSFMVVLLSTPALIKVAILKRLFDEPKEERKIHTRMVPTIGGIIIFAATVFTFSLWLPIERIHLFEQMITSINDFKYVVAAVLILFFVGIKDDIIGTAPMKKLIAHIIVAFILVEVGNIKLTGFHGLFGIREIPEWGKMVLSVFTYVVVVNAFNLIDGIDGLAAGVGLICSLAFGFWFSMAGEPVMATLSFALAGSLFGFLFFNFSPAKIFMGDSGSLTIGLIICVLAIKLIEFDFSVNMGEDSESFIQFNTTPALEFISTISKPIFAMAVLCYPLLDTLRIFIYRTVRGLSPFAADRNHIHHRLIDIGLSHRQTALAIYCYNIIIIGVGMLTRYFGTGYRFLFIAAIAVGLAQIPFMIKKVKNSNYKPVSSDNE